MPKVTNAQLKTLLENNATTTNTNFQKAKTAIAGKVDVVEGKGLSTNDFTDELQTKLNALPTNDELTTSLGLKANAADVYTKGETDTAISTAVANANHLKKEIVQTLPEVANADGNTIYLISAADGKTGDAYDEYTLINDAFEKIGSTRIDVTTLQAKITSTAKLDADLVDDTNSTNKFVTAAEKTAIANIDDSINTALSDVFANLSITAWDDIVLS